MGKSETDAVTTTTTAPPNKKNEKSRETPPSPNKPETSVTVDTNRKPNHETGSDESQENSDFFGRMIDRKRKANEDHDDSEFSSKKRIADTNDSEGDEEASK